MARNRYNNRFCRNHSRHNFFFGVPMSFRRVGWVAAMALATWLEVSCGQVYRPVVIPIGITSAKSSRTSTRSLESARMWPQTRVRRLQIDVSGDSNIGQANVGVNPTHAAILPNNSRVFVASAGSLFPGHTDVVTSFFPAGRGSIATGLGTTNSVTFPNIGAIIPGTNPPQPYLCSYLPDFVATTQTNTVFVANYGVENDPNCNFSSTDSVAVMNTSQNTHQQHCLFPAGSHIRWRWSRRRTRQISTC